MPQGFRNPGEYALKYEDVWITTRDKIKIHGWLVKTTSNSSLSRTIIFFHGNAGNIGARLPNIDLLVKRLQSNVLIIDSRGYGNSEGTPNEAGLELDAEATLEFIKERSDIDQDKLYVFGRSLGGAVAT